MYAMMAYAVLGPSFLGSATGRADRVLRTLHVVLCLDPCEMGADSWDSYTAILM